MNKHFCVEVSLLTESKLYEKDGTQSTSLRIRFLDIWTIPIWVTGTVFPFGSLTEVFKALVIEVKMSIEWAIWSVAPVSTIHVLSDIKVETEALKEKLEFDDIPWVEWAIELEMIFAAWWLVLSSGCGWINDNNF